MIPHTEYERLILLDEIERGDKVVIPTSMEHAEFMLKVAQFYIDQQHEEMVNVLKQENRNENWNQSR
jgi:hypothetical protein